MSVTEVKLVKYRRGKKDRLNTLYYQHQGQIIKFNLSQKIDQLLENMFLLIDTNRYLQGDHYCQPCKDYINTINKMSFYFGINAWDYKEKCISELDKYISDIMAKVIDLNKINRWINNKTVKDNKKRIVHIIEIVDGLKPQRQNKTNDASWESEDY